MLNEEIPPSSLTVTIQTKNMNKKAAFESIGKASQEFHIKVRGKYEFCISNTDTGRAGHKKSSLDRMQVGFNVHVRSFYEAQGSIGPQIHAVANVQALTDNFGERIDLLLDHMEYMKERERMHRAIAEETFENIWKWTLVEKGILVGVSLAQIYYIRTFFAKERRYAYI